MLSDDLTPERILFGAYARWDEAVRAAFAPLVADGSVQARYVDTVVDAIAAPQGTYMDLGKGVTLTHARPEHGVNRTAVAFLRLDDELHLADDPNHPVRLVVALGAVDTSSHQKTMATIAKILVDTTARSTLLAATSADEVLDVVRSAES